MPGPCQIVGLPAAACHYRQAGTTPCGQKRSRCSWIRATFRLTIHKGALHCWTLRHAQGAAGLFRTPAGGNLAQFQLPQAKSAEFPNVLVQAGGSCWTVQSERNEL